MTQSSRRNASIEGLRGFSALLVILYHCVNLGIAHGFIPALRDRWAVRALAAAGPFGVDLFFVISGCLIVQSLSRHGSVAVFLRHRVLRVYPVFFCLHVLVFLLAPLLDYSWMGPLFRRNPAAYALHFFSNLVFLPGLFPLPIAQKNAWSLSYEWAFYLLASGFFFARSRQDRTQGLVLGAPLVAATGVALYFRPMAWFFVVGVAIYAARDRIGAVTISPVIRGGYGAVALGLTFVAVVLVGPLAAAPFAFLFFASMARQEGVFAALMQTPPLQFLGRVSYSLYLIHPFVLIPVAAGMERLPLPPPAGFWLFTAAGLGLSVLAAALSFRYVEGALTRRLRRLLPPEADVPPPPLDRKVDRRRLFLV